MNNLKLYFSDGSSTILSFLNLTESIHTVFSTNQTSISLSFDLIESEDTTLDFYTTILNKEITSIEVYNYNKEKTATYTGYTSSHLDRNLYNISNIEPFTRLTFQKEI